MTNINTLKKTQQKKECTGKLFRARTSNWINDDGVYNEKIQFYPLKKRSCPGCQFCGWIDEEMAESVSCDHPPILPKNIKEMGIYKLRVINVTRDWETGIVDDYDLEFVEVKQSGT